MKNVHTPSSKLHVVLVIS